MDDLVTVPGHRAVGSGSTRSSASSRSSATRSAAIPGIYLISEAALFRIPTVVLARMTFNTMVDMAIGIIPFVGDIFDFFSKSNANNLALFRRYALEPETSTGPHRSFFAGLGLILLGTLWLSVTILALVHRPAARAVRRCSRRHTETTAGPRRTRRSRRSRWTTALARLPAPPPPDIPPEGRRAAGLRSRCPAVRIRDDRTIGPAAVGAGPAERPLLAWTNVIPPCAARRMRL